MSKDIFTTSDSELATTLTNTGIKLAPLAISLGLTAADATAVSNDATALRAAVADCLDKHTTAKAVSQSRTTLRSTIEKRSRTLLKRIKASPNYTAAIGQQLGIVSATNSISALVATASNGSADVRPVLKGIVNGDGTISVKFTKQGYSGVMLYSRRGGETRFTLLGKQLCSPCVDARPNLVSDEPETREYRALYLDNDQTVGQASDTVVVTAPAALAASSGANTVSLPLAKAA